MRSKLANSPLTTLGKFYYNQIRYIFKPKDHTLKIFRILFKTLLVLAVFLGLSVLLLKQLLKPTYDGELNFDGITSEVEVYYDRYGIPHIYANSEEEAVKVLGYVHAQDRLWQMELLRRVARGGLSEVFGKQLLSTDKFFLSLGIDEASAETVAHLDTSAKSYKMAQAYLEGINYFIEEGPTPIEFYLTGLDKTPFTLKDIHNAIGYMAFSFAQGHKTDPLLTDIGNTLGSDYLVDLEVDVDPSTEWIQNYNPTRNQPTNDNLVAAVHKALEPLPIPQLIGSNSWVISGSKTKEGGVILANDPHIGFAQPSVWYEAHLITPEYEKYGFHLAGIPFPLLGHDRNLAYGLTMFENDDTDFYYEELHPSDSNKYKTDEGYKSFEIVERNIKVKDTSDVLFQYKKSVHGPVLNGIAEQIQDSIPISLAWIYTKLENRLLESLYQLSHGENIEEFRKALPLLHAPGLNVMYGDAKGNIAWWATAQLYQLPDSLHRKFVLDGSQGNGDPLRYLEFEENPQAVNPPWGYVYSANNQPDSIAGMLYPGYYLSENRANRIVQLLDQDRKWNKEEVSSMVTDVVSTVNLEVVQDLFKEIEDEAGNEEEAALLDALLNWDGNYSVNSREASLYHRWIYHILKNTFEDELGEERFAHFLKTHFHKRLIAPLIGKPASVWWDDRATIEIEESKSDIIRKSLRDAFDSLYNDLGPDINTWTWGRIHTLEHRHPIGEVAALRSFFNVGPFPMEGTREVINNMAFQYDNGSSYKVNSGPSTRRVIDFSDIENGLSILPTGQSGNPFSKHYEDQAAMYNNGEYRKMMLNKEEIVSSSKSLLIFSPH